MQAPPKLRVESLAQECADLSPELRYARLDEECNGDEDFRKEVEAAIRKLLESQKTDILSSDYERAIPAHYRLVDLLGRGGMAEVFRAKDTRLDRSVAIKFLNSEFRKDPERMRRFNQEARAVSALNHPNILVIHDVGENEGIQYIVTEFVDGETLSKRISRGSIELHEAVEIAIQIASALAASHKAGIVHRDIKPDNVMIRRDGVVKVLDFGLAKESIDPALNAIDANAATLDKALTSPGLILGTPQYMSPEQARGRQLDARTDIFSLGIIIFEMASGRPPFSGGSMVDVIASIISKDTPSLEDHMADPPESLRRIIDKSLRKNVEERYSTMDSVMSDLKEAQRELADGRVFDASITAGQEVRTTVQNTAETEPFKFAHWNAVFAALALVAAGLALWWYVGWSASSTTPGTMRTVAITSWSSESGELSSSASFSPDGRMIAYWATHDGSTEIWLKPTAGGDAIQITKNGFFNRHPIWSPFGQDIAFFSERGDRRSIWRTSFTGGEQIEIAGGVGEIARPLLWGKNGRIFFQDANELFVTDERSGSKTKLTDFAAKGIKPRSIELSPDETTVAYSIHENESWKVRIMRLGTDAATEIATSKEQIDYLSWRPDGKSLIFSMSVDGAFQLFEAGTGIESPRQISNGNNDFFVQDVAADDSKILYASVSETSDLWSVTADDLSENLIASEVAAEYWPNVSPDGKSVVFQSAKQVGRAKSGSVNVVAPGASSRVISQTGHSPVWSNDGEWIAFFRRVEGQIGLWRIRPGGDEASKIADRAVKDANYTETPYLMFGTNHLSWSPDSSALAYAASPDGASNIWVANVTSNDVTKITKNEDKTAALSGPIWTPDGRSLVVFSSSPSPGGSNKRVYRLTLHNLGEAEERMLFESNDLLRFLGLGNSGKEALFAQRSDPASMTLVADTMHIYSVSLDTGDKKTLNTLTDVYFNNIHLSRDGSTIAFVSRRDNTTALWAVPVNGGTPKRLLAENDPKILFSSLAWSPDGRSIVFGKQTRTNLISMLAK